MSKIFRFQIWQLICALISIFVFYYYIVDKAIIVNNNLFGISTYYWFWIAVFTPILHQFYVAFVWRFELYKQTFTSRFGLKKAFKMYSIGFSLLFVSRLIFIFFLAISDKDSLKLNSFLIYFISVMIFAVAGFLFYSVKKYFTLERAYGIDHFDKDYNEPFEKRGIFKYSNNAMYVYGLMVLYLPGLLLFSKAAIVVALFNHLFIWAHYYFTELPDMREIYGKSPSKA